MYYVVYVDLEGREHREGFPSQGKALHFYKRNLKNMFYGYISDEEAMETAKEVKEAFEETFTERQAEMTDMFRNMANYLY